MKNITNNSRWGKLTLLLNIAVLVFFIISMLSLMKFDKTNRPVYEKAYEDYIMAQHPLKQDSAEVAYYQYKLDTLQQKLAKAEKAAKADINDMINTTKETLGEKKKLQSQHQADLASLESEYKPINDNWNKINDDNAKSKKGFIVIAVITGLLFIVKLLLFTKIPKTFTKLLPG